jgi:uncharacterized protein (DUF2236 family)
MAARRLLGPGTLTWEVNREPAAFLGGGRALLMQVAHPAVAAGVSRHSDYQNHPWQRLVRTVDTTLKMAFANEGAASDAAARLARVHKPVHGRTEDGLSYSAGDPELMLWVWATLVDTTVLLYETCIRSLSDDDRERLYSEQKLFARACGLSTVSCPHTWEDFTRYVNGVVRNDLQVNEDAQVIANSVLNPGPASLSVITSLHSILTVYLLPDELRDSYDIPPRFENPHVARRVLRSASVAFRLLPGPVRRIPVTAAIAIPQRFTQPRPRREQVPSGVAPGARR